MSKVALNHVLLVFSTLHKYTVRYDITVRNNSILQCTSEVHFILILNKMKSQSKIFRHSQTNEVSIHIMILVFFMKWRHYLIYFVILSLEIFPQLVCHVKFPRIQQIPLQYLDSLFYLHSSLISRQLTWWHKKRPFFALDFSDSENWK